MVRYMSMRELREHRAHMEEICRLARQLIEQGEHLPGFLLDRVMDLHASKVRAELEIRRREANDKLAA